MLLIAYFLVLISICDARITTGQAAQNGDTKHPAHRASREIFEDRSAHSREANLPVESWTQYMQRACRRSTPQI